jgi:hypothetical protein
MEGLGRSAARGAALLQPRDVLADAAIDDMGAGPQLRLT